MEIPNVERSLAKIGVPRGLRKRIRGASRSPNINTAAALVPLVAAGIVAVRKLARRGL